MPEQNYILTITWDSTGDFITQILTFLKAKQTDLQERIETDLKFKMDMGASILIAGLAANILATERMGGHPKEQLFSQAMTILRNYIDHGGAAFAPNEVHFG